LAVTMHPDKNQVCLYWEQLGNHSECKYCDSFWQTKLSAWNLPWSNRQCFEGNKLHWMVCLILPG
jgi:hypothetical protein